ncbi:MAG: ABC transporter permease [Ruminococcus flavefaciens]|nr:ABC transporter permease [Ruminococcus flavefaciens]
MLTLNKRYKRNFKKNLSFYILSAILTAIAIALYLCFQAGINGEKAYLENFYADNVVEDGQFILPVSLDDEQIADLENKYDVKIEANHYVNCEEENYNVRAFSRTYKVNKYAVIDGNDASSDSEAVISRNFADANSIAIGDTIELKGNTFSVTGIVERPDYLFMLEEISDSYHNDEEFGICVLSDEGYQKISSDGGSEYYSVAYADNATEDDKITFRQALYDEYNTLQYTPAEMNQRITKPNGLTEQLGMYANMILPVIMLIVIILSAVVLGRHLKRDSRQIGVLLALGIKKSQIIRHYVVFPLIPAILGSILGIILSISAKSSIVSICFFKIENLPAEYNITPLNFIMALILPSVLYGIFSLVQIVRISGRNVTGLLRGQSTEKTKKSVFKGTDKMKIRTAYMIRTLTKHKSRTLSFVAGVIISGIVMVYALFVIDSCINYRDEAIKIAGDFTYEYFLKNFSDDEVKSDTAVAVGMNFEVKDSDGSLSVLGVEDNPYLNFDTESGNSADLDDGKFYLTSMASKQYGVEAGDTIEFFQSSSMKFYKVKIDDIVTNDVQCVLYSSRENICELFELPEDVYNVVMSSEKLDYSDSVLSSTVSKKSMRDQIQAVIDGIIPSMTTTVVIGCIICVIVVYLMVNMLIQENSSMISMLKILGLKNKEINGMVLNVYYIVLIISSLLGLGLGYLFSDFYFKANVESFNCYIKAYISWSSILIYFACIFASYFVSLLLLRRKVDKADIGESLKSNLE